MGYDTYYELEIFDVVKGKTISKGDVDFPEARTLDDEITYLGVMLADRECELRWYDHDKDMTELSLRYPELLFRLDGEGEGSGDIWRTYYFQGKAYYWRLNFTRPSMVDFPDLCEAIRVSGGARKEEPDGV